MVKLKIGKLLVNRDGFIGGQLVAVRAFLPLDIEGGRHKNIGGMPFASCVCWTTMAMISYNSNMSSWRHAVKDIKEGTFGTFVWFHLAWQDIRLRYRRSIIGPFWITLSMGLFVCAMGPLYGKLLHQEIGPYFQYIVVSFIIWSFLASQINESCTAFIGAEGFIKQIKMPLSIHLHRVMARSVIMLAHNLLVVIIVLFFFPPKQFVTLLLAPVGFALVLINLAWIGFVLSILCARFRDIPQAVTSVMQLVFFLTPIVWKRELLGNHAIVADLNILYHFMEIIRAPLLGAYPTRLSYAFVIVSALIGWTVALLLFRRFRSRIVYWV